MNSITLQISKIETTTFCSVVTPPPDVGRARSAACLGVDRGL
ncbi:hypothetical protein [Candidatus Igneacidithiobacillus taiwanensis]|nr:hypothetical protein [Candidatus Igneacidithiobacillus taiwanensis]